MRIIHVHVVYLKSAIAYILTQSFSIRHFSDLQPIVNQTDIRIIASDLPANAPATRANSRVHLSTMISSPLLNAVAAGLESNTLLDF